MPSVTPPGDWQEQPAPHLWALIAALLPDLQGAQSWVLSQMARILGTGENRFSFELGALAARSGEPLNRRGWRSCTSSSIRALDQDEAGSVARLLRSTIDKGSGLGSNPRRAVT
jgi:hypothetical protein